jgi:hypothetical protein
MPKRSSSWSGRSVWMVETPPCRAWQKTGPLRTDAAESSDDMVPLRFRRDRPGVAAYLASGDLAADVAALLRRWTDPRRPAVLVVLDWDPPWADVYPEDELLEAFPDAPMVQAVPAGEIGPGTLLVLVIDAEGETAYTIADPRASN